MLGIIANSWKRAGIGAEVGRISGGVTTGANAFTLTVNVPPHQEGDVFVVLSSSSVGSANVHGSFIDKGAAGSFCGVRCQVREATASEPVSYTFTFASDQGRMAVSFHVIRNTTPDDVTTTTTSALEGWATCPAITVDYDGSFVARCVAGEPTAWTSVAWPTAGANSEYFVGDASNGLHGYEYFPALQDTGLIAQRNAAFNSQLKNSAGLSVQVNPSGSAPAPFVAHAVVLDGNDTLTKTGGITTWTDKRSLLCSFWFHIGDFTLIPDGTRMALLWNNTSTDGNKIELFKFNDSFMVFNLGIYSAQPYGQAIITSNMNIGWNHIQFDARLDNGAIPIVETMNDIVINGTTVTAGASEVFSTDSVWDFDDLVIGDSDVVGEEFVGEIAEFWLSDKRTLAVTAEANSFFHVSSGGSRVPKDLGVSGIVDGHTPLIYLRGPASSWNAGTNHGTAGNFDTVAGAVTDSTNEPVSALE